MNAVVVEIRDSLSGRPEAFGATIELRDGGFAASTTVNAGDSLSLAVAGLGGERPGVYEVTVTKPGFQRWSRRDVRVSRSDCGVSPAYLFARLVR